MALDPKATDVTLNYPGGYVEMSRGLAEYIFGANNKDLETVPELVTRTVKAHSRVRVIGQPATSVSAYQYTYDKYPTSSADPAKGGREIFLNVGDGKRWTARVGGSFASFGNYLGQKTILDQVFFQSKAGTKYGPFSVDQN